MAWIQAEQRDRDQVADEEERLQEGERQGGEEHHQEDVQHALLRVLRADGHHLLGIGHGGLLGAFQLDVALDELHRAIGAGGDRLRAGAGEPVDHRAAGDQAQQEWRVHQRELVDVRRSEPLVRATMVEKIMVVAPTTAVPISTGLEVALKVLPAPSFSSRFSLAFSKLRREAEVLLNVLRDAGERFDGGKLVDGLRVVGDRAVAIHRDGDRSHAEEAERHQAEGEDRRGQHQVPAGTWC